MASVLIVDDDSDTVEVSTQLLESAGHRILLVSGRADLPEVAGRMGTPYFLKKASPDYGQTLLGLLDRALRERQAPQA